MGESAHNSAPEDANPRRHTRAKQQTQLSTLGLCANAPHKIGGDVQNDIKPTTKQDANRHRSWRYAIRT